MKIEINKPLNKLGIVEAMADEVVIRTSKGLFVISEKIDGVYITVQRGRINVTPQSQESIAITETERQTQ